MAKRKPGLKTNRSARRQVLVAVELSAPEAQILVRVARHYQKAMGPMRALVRMLAPADIKARYRFVAQESKWLERFAQATYQDLIAQPDSSTTVSFTPRTVIAFWGRLLTTLNSPRSRRRLSSPEIEAREALAAKLERAARELRNEDATLIDQEIRTRRETEATWMAERLGE